MLVAKTGLTFCDPMDHSPPGSSVHGIFQARILGWVSFPSPGDLPNQGSNPNLLSLALQVDSLPAKPLGKPLANGIEVYKNLIQVMTLGTSLAGQWLRLHASTAGAWVGSQVGELRPHMPHGSAKK